MDRKGDAGGATRRRGETLEAAILDAAWAQLVDAGYAGFTFEAIAERAGTSRPVLYRRWSDRQELLVAAVRREWTRTPVRMPDTGTLRGDAIAVLRNVDRARVGFVAVMGVRAAEYFSATGTSLGELRDLIRGDARPGFEVLVERAAARGELDPARIPRRVVSVPIDLFRHELMMTFARVPVPTIEQIVDEVWLPLLRGYGARV